MEQMTTTQLTKSFKEQREKRYNYTTEEIAWIKGVFGAIMTVAKRDREFTVDAIWEQIDKLKSKGKLDSANIDHRILGPMIRHMVSLGMLGSTGYYTKSTRTGGGSRPVTVWRSFLAPASVLAA